MGLSAKVDETSIAALLDALGDTLFESIMVTAVGDGKSNTPIVYVNDAFTELTGYSADDVLGRSPTFLQGTGTERGVIDRLVNDLAAGKTFEGQAVNYRKDGSPFVMHWRVVPVRVDGAVTHYLAVQQRA